MKNPIKHITRKIDNFFSSEYTFNKKESIFLIIIFVIFIALSISLPYLLVGVLSAKISFLYLTITFLCFLSAANCDKDWMFGIAFRLAAPYILMLMVSVGIVGYFVPYKGKDPMKLRYAKLKVLKRKAKINKFKFWK
jgi:hypothetical protein